MERSEIQVQTKTVLERKTDGDSVIFVKTESRFSEFGLGIKGDIWLMVFLYMLDLIMFGIIAHYGDFPPELSVALFLAPVIVMGAPIIGDYYLSRHPRPPSINRTVLTFYKNENESEVIEVRRQIEDIIYPK
jgi:hypothetical protein